MMDISAALVGGLFDEDGVPAYARPVLFGTAGDAVSAYLPDAVGARFFVQGEGEPQVAGTVCVAAQEDGRFAALKALPACGHVLVIAAPFALTEQDALYHLVQTHTAAGYGAVSYTHLPVQ